MNEQAKQYFFMFTSGTDSRYGVTGLCTCDHKVEESEWEEHIKTYDSEYYRHYAPYEKLRDAGMAANPESPEYKNFVKWRDANDPTTTFIAKHNMQKVEYTELFAD